MHTLLCIVAWICGICNDASYIVSGMRTKSFPGNFRELDSMTSVWAAVLNHHVSIPCPRAQEAQVMDSENFSKPLLDNPAYTNGMFQKRFFVVFLKRLKNVSVLLGNTS